MVTTSSDTRSMRCGVSLYSIKVDHVFKGGPVAGQLVVDTCNPEAIQPEPSRQYVIFLNEGADGKLYIVTPGLFEVVSGYVTVSNVHPEVGSISLKEFEELLK